MLLEATNRVCCLLCVAEPKITSGQQSISALTTERASQMVPFVALKGGGQFAIALYGEQRPCTVLFFFSYVTVVTLPKHFGQPKLINGQAKWNTSGHYDHLIREHYFWLLCSTTGTILCSYLTMTVALCNVLLCYVEQRVLILGPYLVECVQFGDVSLSWTCAALKCWYRLSF